MLEEIDLDEIEMNQQMIAINNIHVKSESLERRIKKTGLDLHEEDIDKIILMNIMVENEIY